MNFPLFLTSARVVLALVTGAVLVSGMPYNGPVAAACFVVAAATDFFDGRLARAWNQTTELGAFLDPLGDKLLVYIAFMHLTSVGLYPVWLLLLMFARDIAVDGLRAFSVGKGVSLPANLSGKWKSFLQMGSLALLLALGAVAQTQALSAWGSVALAPVVASRAFDAAFGAVYWLMLAAVAVGYVSMAQYFARSSFLFGPPRA